VTQPTFVPVADSSAVRPSSPTANPQIGRPPKRGLLGAPTEKRGPGEGTPGPDGGYALHLAEHLLHGFDLAGVPEHDAVIGLALLAAKRAALVGRAPTRTDVEVAMDLFGFRQSADVALATHRRRLFAGLAHSYIAQRTFVDTVPASALTQAPGAVRTLWFLSNSRTPGR
jgi:hypothetical protein